MEEVPAEQTRVYQNQPTHQDARPPSESAVLQKTRTRPNERATASPVEPEPDYMDHNWIDEDQEEPTQGPPANPAFNSNGAIWVNEATEQPGFLFPVVRTTSQPAVRRQMTEEASLSMTPRQVPHWSYIQLNLTVATRVATSETHVFLALTRYSAKM